ncbi:MAG: hypothetical protein A4E48_02354 [Methanosaeta sp. PtaU1.Bin060]|jgi:hypothetical protein|nr:MAG: hypothetical protein A4E44_02175 [Methanosaeta sp. PtaB.Bin018]OPY49221.1 MAG: hypothetical protein A4E48_02354 [Methanosaeta sp. PtaU1.Bin060]
MFYNCNEFKPISDPEPHHPQNLDEVRGIPLRVYVKDGFCIAVFAWGAISLPSELEARLRELVGHNIACLRFDGKFHIRDLDQESDGTAR